MDRAFVSYLHELGALAVIKRAGKLYLPLHLVQAAFGQTILLMGTGMAEPYPYIGQRPAFAPGIDL